MVDDDPEIGRAIAVYLSEEGYAVSVATSGAQMREIFKRQTVDLVVLDSLLPGENGLEIARKLRAKSNIGIIMLTGRVDVVDSIVGLEVGADEYMAKPANLRELLVREIGVKEVTVAFHLKGVFKKLGVSNRTQAAAMALREGWQPPDVARTFS